MTKWVVLTVVLAAVTGCTRLVGGSPQARPAPPEAAPITPTQAHDLLSQNAQPGEGYVIDRVEPQRCSGVALEVNPPFIASPGPLATGGGHWTTSVGGEVFLEDHDLRVSHYVPLRGRLRAGETATVDIPFPADREVDIEVTVLGWRPGMSLTTDCIGASMDGPVEKDSEYPGPHRFTLYDAADHPIAFAETDIPYDAETWRVEIEAKPCEECGRDCPQSPPR